MVSLYVTVGCPSVRPSVSPVGRQQQRRAAGLLLSSGAGDRYRPILAIGRWPPEPELRPASCSDPREEGRHRLV